MSMFDTFGKSSDSAGRKPNTLRKLERMNKTLRHEEADRVPVSDFFWGGLTRRWRQELACRTPPIPITTMTSIGSPPDRTSSGNSLGMAGICFDRFLKPHAALRKPDSSDRNLTEKIR